MLGQHMAWGHSRVHKGLRISLHAQPLHHGLRGIVEHGREGHDLLQLQHIPRKIQRGFGAFVAMPLPQ